MEYMTKTVKLRIISIMYCLGCLAIIGLSLYGGAVTKDWRDYLYFTVGGAAGLLVCLLFVAQAFGILDRFIY